MPRPVLISTQAHVTRESWLAAAAELWRPVFQDRGHPLPDRIQYAIAFPSTGQHGRRIGEHWAPGATEDNTHTIILRADLKDPVQVLDVLTHELCHAAAPPNAKHGRKFAKVCEAVGLKGPWKHASVAPETMPWIHSMLATLGPLPNSPLRWAGKVRKKAERDKPVKVFCPCCDYRQPCPESGSVMQVPPGALRMNW